MGLQGVIRGKPVRTTISDKAAHRRLCAAHCRLLDLANRACATLGWVDWFNNRRPLEPIGNIPPVEAEERYCAIMGETAVAA